MKKLVMAVLLTVVLVGCSSAEEKTKKAYCESSLSTNFGYEEVQNYEFEYEDDVVKTQKITITTTFTDEAYLDNGEVSQDTKDLLQDQADLIQSIIKDSEGVTHTVNYQGASVIEVYTIDYGKATNYELVSIGLLSASDSDAEYISMEKTISNLTNVGMTCTE